MLRSNDVSISGSDPEVTGTLLWIPSPVSQIPLVPIKSKALLTWPYTDASFSLNLVKLGYIPQYVYKQNGKMLNYRNNYVYCHSISKDPDR